MIDKSKVETQRRENAKKIVDVFPYLTFDDAEVCLKCNDESLEKVQNFLIDFSDQFALLEAVDKMRAKLVSKEDDMKMEELPSQEYTLANPAKIPPCIAGKIIDFSE